MLATWQHCIALLLSCCSCLLVLLLVALEHASKFWQKNEVFIYIFYSINMQVYNGFDLDNVFEPVALAVRKASKGLCGYGAVAAEAALLETTACQTIKRSRLIAALVPA